MSYRVEWSRAATKELLAIEKRQRLMILKWVDEHLDGCESPCGIVGSKQLRGTRNGWRCRVGSYRILASVLDDRLVIEVVRAGHRQGVYRSLPKDL